MPTDKHHQSYSLSTIPNNPILFYLTNITTISIYYISMPTDKHRLTSTIYTPNDNPTPFYSPITTILSIDHILL